jgi:flagellar hook-associated protein 1 FlgK
MLGLFSTLDMANRSMQTQMTGVEVAGQNIANVNTPGYSRQRVDITTTGDVATAAGMEGTGAQAARIQQVVSDLLNGQITSNASDLGYQQGRQSALQSLQDAFGETLTTDTTGTSSTGLSKQLSDFFSAMQGVATTPNSLSARQALIGAAQGVTTMFNNISKQFSDLKTSLNTSLSSDVDSANKYLAQIASLNGQIYSAEFSGGTANDLRDQRQLALENLSKLSNFTTSTNASGQISVTIGGQTLVNGAQLADSLKTYDAGGGQLLLQTATGGAAITLTGGQMQGTISARDNELATAASNLDKLAAGLSSAVNNIHVIGFSPSVTSGQSFFNGSSAAAISVNPALVNDPMLIQASSSGMSGNGAALQMAQLADSAQTSLNNETFANFYGDTLGSAGSALNDANTQATNQQAVADMLTTQRGAVSGVNIDEEMTNLLTFQRSYSASAELLKTVDQMIQTTLQLKT